MKKSAPLLYALLFSTVFLSTPVFADAAPPVNHQAASLSEGVVKKIDQAAGKVTLAHGPLANLNMPAMTMAFLVKEPQWLSRLKPGDKVSFIAEQLNGRLTVTSLQVAP